MGKEQLRNVLCPFAAFGQKRKGGLVGGNSITLVLPGSWVNKSAVERKKSWNYMQGGLKGTEMMQA